MGAWGSVSEKKPRKNLILSSNKPYLRAHRSAIAMERDGVLVNATTITTATITTPRCDTHFTNVSFTSSKLVPTPGA